MKKIIITVAVIIVVLIAGIYLITSHDSKPAEEESATKVGVILNGSINDKSWTQSHYEGIEETAKKLDLEITYSECVSADDALSVINGFADSGCEIIIANSAMYTEQVAQAAEMHPEIFFFHATGVTSRKNLSTYFGRMYQMRYLTGVAAGLQTDTNEIGYAAAFPVSEVNRGINAFTLGVRSVNPEAKVYVRWINSWNDDAAATDAAEALISSHNIDILAMHTDSLEPLRIAEEHGIMSIGYNIDNSGMYPESCLTAAVWDWEKFYTPHIQKCIQGKFEGANYWESADTGIIGTAPLSPKAKDGIAEAVEREYTKLRGGTYDVFYGPVYDNEGNLRVAEGESMTDNAMLNEFNWYAEGVVIDG